MPIIRRDESTDPMDPYILAIWNKKWIIAGAAILTGILVYLVLVFVPSVYRVNAEIFVNRLPSLTDGETPNPESVVSLLESQSVINKVRDEYAAKFNVDPKPLIERFAKSFKVESQVLQDTSVRKEFSPVLTLEVEAVGAEETQYIMSRWIYHFINEFGNYTATEAVMKRQAYEAEKSELDAAIEVMEQEQAKLDARLPYLRKMLAEQLESLSPARLRLQDDLDQGSNNVELELTVSPNGSRKGLMERYTELELARKTGSTTATAQLEALASTINETKTSVTEAQNELAEVLYQQRVLSRKVQLLRNTQSVVNDAYSRFVVGSATFRETTEADLPAGGDIRALTMPVTPEQRVWPKRTTAAALAAIAAAILTMFAILARNFLTKISTHPVQ